MRTFLYVRESEREKSVFNTFINFEPVERFQNRKYVRGFRNFNDNTSKRILNKLKTIYLRLWKIIIQRVTVVMF